MKHTECEDCKLKNGDCGHHFKMNGKGETDFDIPSLTACDRYGNCGFFQQKEKPQGDLISREALKEEVENLIGYSLSYEVILNAIDNAPTVELDEGVIQEVLNKRCMTAVANEYLIALHGKRLQGEWIPVSERLPDKNGYYLVTLIDEDYSGNNILITQIAYWTGLKWDLDFAECNFVIAWQPLPEPYKEGEKS